MRVDECTINEWERLYPGIRETILHFENSNQLPCTYCGASDTGNAQVGFTGRSIHIARATSKFKLLVNGPIHGQNFCSQCRRHFN
jgi:hypothetical protein